MNDSTGEGRLHRPDLAKVSSRAHVAFLISKITVPSSRHWWIICLWGWLSDKLFHLKMFHEFIAAQKGQWVTLLNAHLPTCPCWFKSAAANKLFQTLRSQWRQTAHLFLNLWSPGVENVSESNESFHIFNKDDKKKMCEVHMIPRPLQVTSIRDLGISAHLVKLQIVS